MSAEPNPVMIMNRQPRPILDIYSTEQVRLLYHFLHNENPPYRYVFGFRKKGVTDPVYANADKWKRLPAKKFRRLVNPHPDRNR